jgi:hypothetical protein
MTFNYPDDADGKALRRVAAAGANMSKPMDIDFQIAAPDEATARRVADEAAKLGYRTRVYGSLSAPWKCQCTKSMIPAYPSLMAAQAELDTIARPFGAYADGWGTYGRGKRYTMSGSQPEPANRRWCQYNHRSLLAATLALGILFGLSCVAFGLPLAICFLAAIVGLPLCGGVSGAAVGYAVDPRHGSMVRQGAIVGAIAVAVSLLLYAMIEVFLLCLMLWNFRVAG